MGSVLGSGRSPWVGKGQPTPGCHLENSIDRGAWQATVHGGLRESDTAEHTAQPTFAQMPLSTFLLWRKGHIIIFKQGWNSSLRYMEMGRGGILFLVVRITTSSFWNLVARAPTSWNVPFSLEWRRIAAVAQSLSHVWLFATPWIVVCLSHGQASLSSTISWSLCKLMSIKSGMPSNHLILFCPLPSCLQSFPASLPQTSRAPPQNAVRSQG